MLKGMKLKAYPNCEQRQTLFCMFGNQRFVWNQMLNMLNERYENNKKSFFPSSYELDLCVTQLKREYSFLSISDSTALQVVDKQLIDAFKRFFKRIGGHPNFHSRKASKKSFTGKSKI